MQTLIFLFDDYAAWSGAGVVNILAGIATFLLLVILIEREYERVMYGKAQPSRFRKTADRLVWPLLVIFVISVVFRFVWAYLQVVRS